MDRLHARGGIRDRVRKALEAQSADGRVEDGVYSFYIEASPDGELPPDKFYRKFP